MIHPTAVVDRRAEIDPSVEVGPYAVLEGPVRIGARTRILAHVVVTGNVTLGEDNEVHPGAVVGGAPQDLSWKGGESYVRIGNGNVFREGTTVHRGTKPESTTIVGDRNYFMQNSHVAHNCRVADDAVLVSGAVLAGYVELQDRAFVSGNCTVHQFVRVGRYAFLRGLSRTSRDVPPFCVMDGTHTVRGVNLVGLRRAGFDRADVRALRNAFRILFLRRRNLRHALAEVDSESSPAVTELIRFIGESKRGVCFGPKEPSRDGPGED